jgi:hypothetical protein
MHIAFQRPPYVIYLGAALLTRRPLWSALPFDPTPRDYSLWRRFKDSVRKNNAQEDDLK